MNDESLEHHLRNLPELELPSAWRAEILATARRDAHASAATRPVWPPLLIALRHLFAQNPFTVGALTAIWMLILLLKASTPVDPRAKQLIAHYDPRQPVYLVSLDDEIRLVKSLQDQPEPKRPAPIQ